MTDGISFSAERMDSYLKDRFSHRDFLMVTDNIHGWAVYTTHGGMRRVSTNVATREAAVALAEEMERDNPQVYTFSRA